MPLPAHLTRPGAAPAPPAPPDGFAVLESDLAQGLPARLPLREGLSLVLSLPLGRARRWQAADPLAVLTDTAARRASLLPAPTAGVGDLPGPRLTLLVGDQLGTTVPAVPDLVHRLGTADGRTELELLVLDLVLTAGTLRGPGAFSSRLSLAWRAALAPLAGPPLAVGDPTIPRRRRGLRPILFQVRR